MYAAPRSLLIRRADRFASRLVGLLAGPPLVPGEGLLLVPCNAVHTAFLRTSIDVVFLDRHGRIRRIVPHLAPWRIAACLAAHQTLELAAGESARLGLLEGASLAECLTPCRMEPCA